MCDRYDVAHPLAANFDSKNEATVHQGWPELTCDLRGEHDSQTGVGAVVSRAVSVLRQLVTVGQGQLVGRPATGHCQSWCNTGIYSFVFVRKSLRPVQIIPRLWDVGWRGGGGGEWLWEKWMSPGLATLTVKDSPRVCEATGTAWHALASDPFCPLVHTLKHMIFSLSIKIVLHNVSK